MSLRQRLIAGLAFGALAWLLWTGLDNLEYVDEVSFRPLTGEARSNPLYASRLFLKGMGIPTQTVESLQSLNKLPDTDTVLFISATRYNQREEQFEAILDWVKRGGHLITRSVLDWDSYATDNEEHNAEDTAVDTDNDKPNADSEIPTAPPDTAANSDNDNPAASADPLQLYLGVYTGKAIPFDEKDAETLQLPEADKPLEIANDYYRAIDLSPDNDQQGLTQVKLNDRNFIIHQQVGKGLITLVSDFTFIENYNIDDYDHAEILWHLVHANNRSLQQPAAIWLIHSEEMPHLFRIIWKHFWPFCIMLGGLLLIWMLRVSHRFGPLIPKEGEDRRNLLEHIEASGNYYWKNKEQAILIDSTRHAVQQQLAKRIPAWHAMSNDQQAHLLAERVGIDEQQILHLLHGDIRHKPHEFTETIKQLEHIRITV
ncbi:MAG: hypothetical protein CSB47_10260 [Proteobacteria bacterium]|nr:MAG: hypothetical protein CSB47_10260 [Pseudomonadota bacterium]